MFHQIIFIMLHCAVCFGQPYPYAAPLQAVPSVTASSPTGPLVPTAYPFGPSGRPLVPGFPGYNNPLYNQYNRVPNTAVPILTYSSEHVGDGTYSFSYTTADGKQAQEAGYLKDAYIDNAGEPQGTQVVQGSYAYISPEGTPIQVSYIADENGFRPSGVHIPAVGKAAVPVIPDKEQRILDPLYNKYNPYAYRGRYNNAGNILNPFNKAYDPRYPYQAAKYNSYYNNQYLAPKTETNISKKSSKRYVL